mmetsp:Transcript_6171/g.20678  ORF Transcript_6171/g.20678 Transcript_6171/m.20678 type:complete len:252 (-) Transcript_6171:605-1360(-)
MSSYSVTGWRPNPVTRWRPNPVTGWCPPPPPRRRQTDAVSNSSSWRFGEAGRARVRAVAETQRRWRRVQGRPPASSPAASPLQTRRPLFASRSPPPPPRHPPPPELSQPSPAEPPPRFVRGSFRQPAARRSGFYRRSLVVSSRTKRAPQVTRRRSARVSATRPADFFFFSDCSPPGQPHQPPPRSTPPRRAESLSPLHLRSRQCFCERASGSRGFGFPPAVSVEARSSKRSSSKAVSIAARFVLAVPFPGW